jgi:hypothetical protein
VNSNSSTYCPVPKEQQPINEYQELQNSWFFGWGKLELPKYVNKLVCIWVGSWLVTAPVAASSFPMGKFPLQFTICAAGGGLLFVALTAIRLYLGWMYIKNRLNSETVFYEESGWYDGQTWKKPPEILTRDRLLVSYEIHPILKRIQLTLATLLGTVLAGACLWVVSS